MCEQQTREDEEMHDMSTEPEEIDDNRMQQDLDEVYAMMPWGEDLMAYTARTYGHIDTAALLIIVDSEERAIYTNCPRLSFYDMVWRGD
jgi:hypothetical protein